MGVRPESCRRHVNTDPGVVPGRGGGFSLEAPEGMRFLTRSRLLTIEESAALGSGPEVGPGGPSALDQGDSSQAD
jgi:Protein of unknown function (DUF779)